MAQTRELMVALLAAGLPVALQAQETVAPTTPAPAAPVQPAPFETTPTQPTSPRLEFRDAEGNPLPPEIQRQLEEQFRKNPPPIMRSTPAGNSGELVVTGQRPRGSVMSDIPAERTFSPLEIRAYGASNIGELIDALGPQVASNRSPDDSGPITLLNARRVSDFSEIARIPSEAIERMEVFPEELALTYGFAANQKVVNIVTFERFQSRFGRASLLLPTEGGRETGSIEGDHFAIREETRLSLGAEYSRSAPLLESDVDLLQLGPTDLGRFRTLLPESERASINGVISGYLIGSISSTLNARYDANGSESVLGLGPDGLLRRDTDNRMAHVGTTHSGRIGRWSWNLTGNYDRISTEILTDSAVAPHTRDDADSVSAITHADLVLSGPALTIPAGPVTTSISGRVAFRDFESRFSRAGVEQVADLSRDSGRLQISLDVPLISRRQAVRSPVGTLSGNVNLAIEHLSDAGTLRTLGYGLIWSPAEALSAIASVSHEESAPTVEQLGAPNVETPNVRTFDFAQGRVVDTTRVFGGNAGLQPDDRHVFRFGMTARPIARRDLTLSIDYVATRTDSPIAPFPILTPQVEAAFPDRFTRDGSGRLLRIDVSPLNFVRSDQQQVRWGINYTRPLGPALPGLGPARFIGSEAELQRLVPPGARIIRAESGTPLARRMENTTSRVFFSLYHTWHFEDEVILRDDFPALDLLGGGALDFRGGQRRHEVEFQAGAYKRGLGVRITANWQSATTLRGQGGPAGDLTFSDLTIVNLNLFANLADQFGGSNAPTWLRGTRVTIGLTNLLNERPRVRDEAGLTPLSYQPGYLDPLGRSATISIRKIF